MTLSRTDQLWADAAHWYSHGLDFPLFQLHRTRVTATPVIAATVPLPFQLNADVESIHDGDTINVTVQWGKRRRDVQQPIRLIGCAALELDDAGGPESREYVAALPGLRSGAPVVLATIKDDKFAPRWDCQVSYRVDGTVHDLAADLIADGWAVPWNGRGTQPKPTWPRVPPGGGS